jgi:hypothetical protein
LSGSSRARLVHRAFELHHAPGDDRQPVAQPLGMRHHMRREQDRRAAIALGADQLLEPLLVDRIETRKRFVEHQQFGLVHHRAEQLDELRHALGELADLVVGGMAEPGLFEQFARALAPGLPRQPAQRAHEGDRLAAFHVGIEPALLGKIADPVAGVARRVMAEQHALALVRLDDPEQHPQSRRLARAIGPEHAIDQPLGHCDADTVHCAPVAEALDEPLGAYRQIAAQIGALHQASW